MSTEHRDPEMDARLTEWAEDRQVAPVHPEEAAQIQRVIAARLQERSRGRVRQGMLLAAAILLAFFAFQRQPTSAPTTTPTTPAAAAPELSENTTSEGTTEEPPSHALAQAPQLQILHTEGETVEHAQSPRVGAEGRMVLGLGADRLGLGADSALHVEHVSATETRIRLERGVIAAEVSPRGDSGTFQIWAGDAVVQVIGTRFGVLRRDGTSPLRVWVAEGIVEVRLGRANWKLEAGQVLEVNEHGQGSLVSSQTDGDTELRALLSLERAVESVAAVTPKLPPAPTAPSLGELRQLLAQGDLAAVLDQLELRLARSPEDVDAWSLLASTARKQGDRDRQLQALQEVIRLDTGRAAQRARFEAAGLLSDDAEGKQEAQKLLTDFLNDPSGPGALEPDARLSLAWMELESGKTEPARIQLEQIIANFPGTSPAVEAAKLLNQLSEK